MRPIPPQMRQELERLPRMKVCVIAPLQFLYGRCEGKIEWDHVWIYAGLQINELWAIVGVCKKHHREKEGQPAIKAAIQAASLMLATLADLAKYPRKNWAQIKKSLGIKV